MSFTEMLPMVNSLSREDKFRLINWLSQDLSPDPASLIGRDQTYPLWSPDTSFEAAAKMLEALSTERNVP